MIQSFIIPVFGAEPLAGVDMESSLVSNYSNQVLSISTQHHSCPTWSLKLRRFSFIARLLEPLLSEEDAFESSYSFDSRLARSSIPGRTEKHGASC